MNLFKVINKYLTSSMRKLIHHHQWDLMMSLAPYLLRLLTTIKWYLSSKMMRLIKTKIMQ